MRTKQGLARGRAVALAMAFGTFLLLSASEAQAVLLFWENFEGSTQFPDQKPFGDQVDLGLQGAGEGAYELWHGGRHGPGGGSLSDDLGIQRWGEGGNTSHMDRVSDGSGLLLRVGTMGDDDILRSFDWRTFLANGWEPIRVGSNGGDPSSGGDRLRDFNVFGPAWTEWTQITAGENNAWQREDRMLSGGVKDLWAGLGMGGGDLDFGKVENVQVQIRVTNPVPEPASLMLLGGGLLALAAGQVRRRARK